mgnify:CR=1 FL=1
MNYFCNTGTKPISAKSNTLDCYLLKIWEYFDKFEVYSTAGDIRPPYHFQFRAIAKVFEGDDDAYEGLGSSPLEAIRELYANLKIDPRFIQREV